MGTSSARRGPTTALWRMAKGAATRYFSPDGGGEMNAREVVARYLAALEETPGQGDPLAVFRFTRKIGQELGALLKEVDTRGWEEVLQDRGLTLMAQGDAALLAQGLSAVLAGSGGGLEEAVVRTSLATVLRSAVQSYSRMTPAQVVRQYLSTALRFRLFLDLGEPMEAAAINYGGLKDRFSHLEHLIQINIPEEDDKTPPPRNYDQWRGLPGWTWVTAMMDRLLKNLE